MVHQGCAARGRLILKEGACVKILRCPDDSADAWHGMGPSPADEKQRDKGVAFRGVYKTDFLMPPLALFYFYVVFANAFNFPTVSRQEFFQSAVVAWGGVLLCLAGLVLLFLSLVSL